MAKDGSHGINGKKFLIAFAIVLAIGFGILFILKLGGPLYLVLRMQDEIEAKQKQLLYHTSHPTLQSELEWLLANPDQLQAEQNHPGGQFFAPDHADYPTVIMSLSPSWIHVDSEIVIVELGGGFYHYGVKYFADASTGEGALKLDSRLWYYAEDGEIPER